METKPATPHRPTTSCVLLVRSLLTTYSLLPSEITALILDYASHWVLASTPHRGLRIETLASAALLTTPPLGTTHSAMADVGFGRMQATIPMRGVRPCRKIRVVYRA